MSLLADPPRADVEREVAPPTPAAPRTPEDVDDAGLPGISRRRIAVLVAAWLAVTLLGVGLVLTDLGPLMEARDQRALLADHRREIRQKSEEAYGLPGIEAETSAPAAGDPVAILDVPSASVRQVVVEGAAPRQTRRGPGHVVGTAGPGQPGNSVIVGRARLFGAPFGDIDGLAEGDEILVTTLQGQSLYVVGHVGTHRIEAEDDAGAASTGDVATDEGADDAEAEGSEAEAELLPDGALTTEQLYGPSEDDRLTLVSSAGGAPWATDRATVVVATLDGQPFTPTPQGGRTPDGDGRSADPDAWAPLALALLGYGLAVATAVWAYRRLSWRAAYLVSAPLLLALTILLAEQVARTFPAWA